MLYPLLAPTKMSTSLAVEGITLEMVKDMVLAFLRFEEPMDVFVTGVQLYCSEGDEAHIPSIAVLRSFIFDVRSEHSEMTPEVSAWCV